MGETIVAYSGGALPGALAVVRLSGPAALDIVGRIFAARSGLTPTEWLPRTLTYGRVLDILGRTLDLCLACVFRSPHSATGEDMAELHCHGSGAVVATVLEHAMACGARPARAGEFTRRAFLAGKLDLTAAEAVADLLDAASAPAARQAAAQLEGAVGGCISDIRMSIVGLLAHFYAACDYTDEDIEPFEHDHALVVLGEAIHKLEALYSGFKAGLQVKNGIPVAIIGRPNGGKSSLFNGLAGQDRAIVTDEAGTTRDVLDLLITCGDAPIRLLDTAGIRAATGTVERLGIDRAKAALEGAAACLAVVDSAAAASAEDAEALALAAGCPRRLLVLTKSDLLGDADARLRELALLGAKPQDFEGPVIVSSLTGLGLDAVRQWLSGLAPVARDGPLITSSRQAGLMSAAAGGLRAALGALEAGMTPDAFLSDVERAIDTLGQVTGETASLDMANEIFSRFCVGK